MEKLPIGMKIDITIAWSTMNDQDMIIYHNTGVVLPLN